MSINGRGYTFNGLKKLAKICRQARGNSSYREFERITGISHGVIRRIEIEDSKMPEYSTLEKLAPHTGFTVRQLQAIAMQEEDLIETEQKYWIAEDIMLTVRQLPQTEVARLAKMIIDYIVEKHACKDN
ncbi:hypothetical protein [Chroococcidiopsis sp.]|uniref:hypothetical protein n=1 Tax=Chroococcidiopsis sp. TaxID=3088168 RepID=UPI003F3DE870